MHNSLTHGNSNLHCYLYLLPPPYLAHASSLHPMKGTICTDARHGEKHANIQAAEPLDKVQEEGTTRSRAKQCTLVVHQIRTTHQEAFHKEVAGKWKGSAMPEDVNYLENNNRNNQESLRQESHQDKNPRQNDGAVEGTLISFHFNGKVRLAANGKAFSQ